MTSDVKNASARRGAARAKGRRRRRARREGTLAIIERLLTRPVSLSLSGKPTQVSAAEAIMLQLMQKALSGNARAWRALQKYQDFAKSRSPRPSELQFVESEYTQAFANSAPRSDDG